MDGTLCLHSNCLIRFDALWFAVGTLEHSLERWSTTVSFDMRQHINICIDTPDLGVPCILTSYIRHLSSECLWRFVAALWLRLRWWTMHKLYVHLTHEGVCVCVMSRWHMPSRYATLTFSRPSRFVGVLCRRGRRCRFTYRLLFSVHILCGASRSIPFRFGMPGKYYIREAECAFCRLSGSIERLILRWVEVIYIYICSACRSIVHKSPIDCSLTHSPHPISKNRQRLSQYTLAIVGHHRERISSYAKEVTRHGERLPRLC